MPASFDSQILRFDDDLQVEARTVLAHTAEPQNAFEVAVILETLGHTDATARARGYDDLFDLARRLHDTLEDVGVIRPHHHEPELRPESWSTSVPRAAALFVGQSLPWLTALFVLLLTGTGFWSSTVFSNAESAAMVLALSVGLVVSAMFTFPFARRATFYRLQGNLTLVGWSARWMLGGGAVGCVAVTGALYLLLERVLAVYTPGDTRAFFEMGVAVAILQLAFAPLYTLRAFVWLGLATAAGAGVLAFGLSQVDHGTFTDPSSVLNVQLASIGAMAVVSIAASWWLLRHSGRRVGVPRKWAIVRSTAPFAVYGGGFFLLVLAGGFTAGGLWQGHFRYVEDYNVVTGTALFVLLALFGYTTFTGERLSAHVGSLVKSLTVAEVAAAATNMRTRLRRDLGNLVIIGMVSGAVLTGMAGLLSSRLGIASLIWHNLALFVGAICAYVALGAGVLSSQMLFVLSRPAVPAGGVVAGVAVAVGSAGPLSLAWSDSAAALVGLVLGTVVFAVATLWTTDRALQRFDHVYYGAL